MDKEISNNYQYPEHLTNQDGIEKTELYVIKITKEQVDRLIEDIDQTLKASTWRLFYVQKAPYTGEVAPKKGEFFEKARFASHYYI